MRNNQFGIHKDEDSEEPSGQAVLSDRPERAAFQLKSRMISSEMDQPVTTEKTATLQKRMAGLRINESDLLEKFVRGSGAGGQKINKTSNCVFLKHLPTGVCIKCQMDRSREMNRYLARRELCEQLEAIHEGTAIAKTQAIEKMRRTNRPRSKNSKKRSVADKRNLSQKKSMRRPPSET